MMVQGAAFRKTLWQPHLVSSTKRMTCQWYSDPKALPLPARWCPISTTKSFS